MIKAWKCFPTKTGNNARMSILTTLVQHTAKVPVNAIKQEKEIKSIQVRNEDIQVFLFDDMFVYVKKPQGIYKKSLTTNK